jgi:hypothetical protein
MLFKKKAPEFKIDVTWDGSNDYDIHYILYEEDGDDIDEKRLKTIETAKGSVKNTNHACFGSLSEEIKENKKTNRIAFLLNNCVDDLPKNYLYDWVNLCKANKTVPAYITETMIAKRSPILKLTGVSPSLLYIYLTSLRMPQEYPDFVKVMFYIMKNYPIMDFYTAWVVASRLGVSNSGHNIMEVGLQYGTKSDDFGDLVVPVKYIVGLRKYIEDPTKYDNRPMRKDTNVKVKYYGNAFNASAILAGIYNTTAKVPIKHLLDQAVLDVLKSDIPATNIAAKLKDMKVSAT